MSRSRYLKEKSLELAASAGDFERKRHAERRAFSRRRDKRDLTTELLRHDDLHDVEAEPDTAQAASRGEEGIENAMLHLRRHAPPVVGESDLDLIDSDAARID